MARISSKPALLGGKPVRLSPYPEYKSLGAEEIRAADRVMKSGNLSCFYGSNDPEFFYGGTEVRSLEEEWANVFDVKHSVSMNSATSALYAAVGALGLGPGDEVIVPPTTMSASVAGVVLYGAIPRFADIEHDRYCIDPISIEKNITSRSKAIIVVHLFGQPAAMDEIMGIAHRHGLKVIEDAAQSPLAFYKGRPVGTIGDIGIFSLNCHKVIQCGEGGVAVTNNNELCKRMQLIRNHAEVVISEGMEVQSPINMIGFNYRLTEIQAAIAREQLKKLPALNKARVELADYLRDRLHVLPFFDAAPVRNGCTHVYYVSTWNYVKSKLGLTRATLIEALKNEGIDQVSGGYVKPLHLQRLFRERKAFKSGYPFKHPCNLPEPRYGTGLCPVAEKLWSEEFIVSNICHPPVTEKDIDDFVRAAEKIAQNTRELIRYEKSHSHADIPKKS